MIKLDIQIFESPEGKMVFHMEGGGHGYSEREKTLAIYISEKIVMAMDDAKSLGLIGGGVEVPLTIVQTEAA